MVVVFGSFFVPPRRACLVFGFLSVVALAWSALCLPPVLRGAEAFLTG